MQIKVAIKDRREPDADRDFWKSKSPEERSEAVEFLREQYEGRRKMRREY